MTHLVSPTNFRIGKTASWQSNIIDNSNNISSNSIKIGISDLLKMKLRRKRLFIVKIAIKKKQNTCNIYSLFIPRIKLLPSPDSLGEFTNHLLYKAYNWNSEKLINNTKNYVVQRRLKNYRFLDYKSAQINKWLTRRMFRGGFNLYYNKQYQIKTATKECPRYLRSWYKRRKELLKKAYKKMSKKTTDAY